MFKPCDCLTKKSEPCKANGAHRHQHDDHIHDVCGAHNKDNVTYREGTCATADKVNPPIVQEQQALPIPNTDALAHVEEIRDQLGRINALCKWPGCDTSKVYQTLEELEEHENNCEFKKEEDMYIVAGTGSRSLQTVPVWQKRAARTIVDRHIERLIRDHGDTLAILSGMAEGFDKLLALRALKFGVKLICAIPNKGYPTYYWAKNSLTGDNREAEFWEIVDQAYEVVWVAEDIHNVFKSIYVNGRHTNMVRNDYMVERADEFLVWDPSTPGTRDAFASIKKTKKPFAILNIEKAS